MMLKRQDEGRSPSESKKFINGVHSSVTLSLRKVLCVSVLLAISICSCTRKDTNIGGEDWYPLLELESEAVLLNKTEVIWPSGLAMISTTNDSAQLSIDYQSVELTAPRRILARNYIGFDHTFQLDGPVHIDIDSLVGLPTEISVEEFSSFRTLADCNENIDITFLLELPPGVFPYTNSIEEGDSTLLNLTGRHPGGLVLFMEPTQVPMEIRIYLEPLEEVEVKVFCTTPAYPLSEIYPQELLTFDPFPQNLRSRAGSFDSSIQPWESTGDTDSFYEFILLDQADEDNLTVAGLELVNCATFSPQRLTFKSADEGSFILPSYLDVDRTSLNGITSASPFRDNLFEDLRRLRIGDGLGATLPALRIQWDNSDLGVPLLAQYFVDTDLYGEIDICPPFQVDIGVGVDTIPLTDDFMLHYDAIIGEGGSDLADKVNICVRIADDTEITTGDLDGQLIIEQSLLPF